MKRKGGGIAFDPASRLDGLLNALVAPDGALELKDVRAELHATLAALDALLVVVLTRELLVRGRFDAAPAAGAGDLGGGVGRVRLAVKVAARGEERLGGQLYAARLALEVLWV